MSASGVDKRRGARASTAEQVAAVARDILIAEGAPAVSMRRVAQAVGITPMAIYRHFENREALLRHIADASFAEIARQWTRTARTGSLEERLHAVLDDYIDFGLAQPRLYEFVFGERRDDARMYPADFRDRRSPTLNVLADLLTEGMADGQLRRDDEWEVAIMCAALVHGFVQLYHGGRIALPAEQFRALCHASVGRLLTGLTT
jgi:AcrR family transcriptional regulator